MSDISQRFETFERKAVSIINNASRLSPDSQATALAMLVTINMQLFREVTAALKARSK